VSAPTIDDALVAALARPAVAETAPEELPLFRATSEAYFHDPGSLTTKGSRDEMLGFGVDAAMVLVTPIALSVARDVLNFVIEQVRAQSREHGKDAIDRLTDRLLRRSSKPAAQPEGQAATPAAPAPEPETPDLTKEQLEEVREFALEKAKQFELPPEKAELLAESLVGSLATA
jgi:hypothetical protein